MNINKSNQLISLFVIFFAVTAMLAAQSQAETDILRAMKDEMTRSINNLALGGLSKPYYISYTVTDANTLLVKASLGAIVVSELNPGMGQSVEVKVGNYSRDNTNFMNMGNMFSNYSDNASFPIDKDYLGIRRALWLSSDQEYKSAAEVFEAKLSALKQQNLSEEDKSLPDFSSAKPVKLLLPGNKINIDKTKWENIAKQLSSVFSVYPDLFSSNVTVIIYNIDVYYTNTEGTETKVPVSIAALRVNAITQADDGESLHDHLLYYASSPEDLPAMDKLKAETKDLADNLVKLRKATVFEDTYSGPILFEGQAAAEMFAQKFFSGGSSLVASRKPVYSDAMAASYMAQMFGESLENKLDKKIVSEQFKVVSKPKMKKFGSTNLIGSYEIDAQGVVPADELVLIDKGILKSMLSDRTPTPKFSKSNGHSRNTLSGGDVETAIGPGVVEISYGKTVKNADLKKLLLKKAKDEGLEYAFIARKLTTSNSGIDQKIDPTAIASQFSGQSKDGALTSPIYLFKVNVKDGSETLVRSASVSGVSLNALKKVEAVSSDKMVYNTLLPQGSGDLGGLFSIVIGSASSASLIGNPASIIAPNGIIINELEVQKDKRPITVKLPVVSNPVGQK